LNDLLKIYASRYKTKGLLFAQEIDNNLVSGGYYFISLLESIDKLDERAQIKIIIDEISTYPFKPNNKVFNLLLQIMYRSTNEIKKEFSSTLMILTSLLNTNKGTMQLWHHISCSYNETESLRWLINLIDHYYICAHNYDLMPLINEFKFEFSEHLIDILISSNKHEMAVSLIFSLMFYKLEFTKLTDNDFDGYLFKALELHSDITFSVINTFVSKIENLSRFRLGKLLNAFEKYLNTSEGKPLISYLEVIFSQKCRANKIQTTFLKLHNLPVLDRKIEYHLRQFLVEIINNYDSYSWAELIKQVDNMPEASHVYKNALDTLLFQKKFDNFQKLHRFIVDARKNGLTYESDLMIFLLLPYFSSIIDNQYSIMLGQALCKIITSSPDAPLRNSVGLLLINQNIFQDRKLFSILCWDLVKRDIELANKLRSLIKQFENPKRPRHTRGFGAYFTPLIHTARDYWQELINRLYKEINQILRHPQ